MSTLKAGRESARPDAARQAPPTLAIEEGDGRRFTLRIETETIRIGRKRDNDIQLSEPHVSKYHAEIRRHGDRFVLVDLGSKSGLLVNGLRAEERTLADGDVITFGRESPPEILFRHPGAHVATETAVTSFLDTVSLDGRGSGLEKLARFLEFTRLIGGQIALGEILENVVDLGIEVTGAERGFLILVGSDGALEYRVARGRAHCALADEATRASETIVRKVLVEGEALVVPDIGLEQDLAEMQSVAHFALRSALALPLRRLALAPGGTATSGQASTADGAAPAAAAPEDVFGVLYLDSQQTQRTFTAIDRDILEALARDASSAIENARLLREAEEKRQLDREMARAREVQAALLPETFWAEDHFEVDGYCVPSRALGGDYLDQFRLPDGRCCLVIADVSGKGMPAALLAASLQGALAAEGIRDQALGAMVGRINRALCRRVPVGKFVTFFCCALSPAGELSWVNAGHVPPIVVKQAEELRTLFTGDMALCFREESEYREGTLLLAPGDTVTLYTDGITEAADPRGEFFGERRLERLLAGSRSRTAADIVQVVTGAVREFTAGAPQQDDITLLALKYLGPGPRGARPAP
jgi:serine phosphatase RsbU (regulator of sigma subunit)